MVRRVRALAVLVILVVSGCGSDDSDSSGPESCGVIELSDSVRGDEYLSVSAQGIDCAEAQRIGKDYANGQLPRGFDCSGNTRLTCREGERTVVLGVAAVPRGE
jgi:hypothetical protein